MKCPNCNSEVNNEDVYCKNCGQEIKNEEKSVVELNNPNFRRRNSHPWLIVGITVFVLAVLFIGIIILTIKYDEEHPTETYKTNEQNTQNEQSEQTDRREKQETSQVEFNGYTFTVPAELKANATDTQLFIYGKNNEWVGVVMTQPGQYNTLVAAKDQIKTLLSNQSGSENYDITNATTEEKQYGGKEFLITKDIKSGIYYLDISYGKADENTIYVISVTKSDGTQLEEADRNTIYSIVASGNKGV